MGVQLIRDATCDRCGKKCSHISEKIYKHIDDEVANRQLKHIESFHYHYNEIHIKFFDDRFPDTESASVVLCGDCMSLFSNWLRNKENEL